MLERFVVTMYSRTSPHQDVNHARQSMFSQGTRGIESIPPTQAAFEQHVKRAAFQAGQVRGQTLHPMQELPSATDWGWNLSSDGWIPTWSILPEGSKACNELIKCGCKSACRGLCKYTKANLPCPALCTCNGNPRTKRVDLQQICNRSVLTKTDQLQTNLSSAESVFSLLQTLSLNTLREFRLQTKNRLTTDLQIICSVCR